MGEPNKKIVAQWVHLLGLSTNCGEDMCDGLRHILVAKHKTSSLDLCIEKVCIGNLAKFPWIHFWGKIGSNKHDCQS